ncbi:hypothetical protein HanIR_Chr12g0608531 [Helianthus annuus]|nr:hypothetical protein HanIR_Chr12g0608531 [Helianthus annuus]
MKKREDVFGVIGLVFMILLNVSSATLSPSGVNYEGMFISGYGRSSSSLSVYWRLIISV